MGILRKSYLVIFIILVSIIIVYFNTSNIELKSFSLNLITEIIGIFITVFLIDYVIQEREKQEKIKILKNAYKEFRRPTVGLLNLLISIYKATSQKVPEALKTTYSEILSTEDFYKAIPYLDFMRAAPVMPSTTWGLHISNEVKSLQNSYNKTIEKYGFALDSTIITEMESISNSHFLQIFGLGDRFAMVDNATNFNRQTLTVLATENLMEALHGFFEHLFSLNEYFGKQVNEEFIIKYDTGIWLDKIAPKVGSGRVDSPK